MKNTIAKALLAIALTGPAAAADWTGFYGGAQVGYSSGDINNAASLDGADLGIHAGYNYDFGTWVIGAEAAYSAGTYELSVPAPLEGQDMTHIKLRAGYDLGQGMIYGVAGWAETTLASTVSSASVSEQGTVFGLGYEHRVSDRVSVGGEYLRTSVDNLAGVYDLEYDTVQARVSFHF